MRHDHDPLVQEEKTVALARASSVSIGQAIKVALKSIGGTAVDAKLKGKPGNVRWRIKVLSAEGTVKVYIDGRSGVVLESRVLPKSLMIDRTQNLESLPR